MIRIGGLVRIQFPEAFFKEMEKSGLKLLPYPEELDYLYSQGDNITFA